MKQWSHLFRPFLTLALILTLFFPSKALFAKSVTVEGTYHQTDARKMKSMINSFRTGKEAWYYKKEGSNKKVRVKKLKKLKYDYKLEKVAMQRAAEISRLFSHTRPDKTSCFTAYPKGFKWKGENIAMGTDYMMTTEFTMNLWKETNESYNGQGHRRNMLHKSFTCVGVACFECDGMKYWVQEFGSPYIGKKKTSAVNKMKSVKVKVK